MVKARRKIAKNKRNLIKKRKILSRVILLPKCLNPTVRSGETKISSFSLTKKKWGFIICNMKRIATQKNGFWKRVGINIPFVLMIAAMVALFSGCLLMWFYAIASLFAFKSSMIFLILAGAGTLCLGLGLALIPAYKKYYDFYNKKMGWEFPDKPEKEEKTTVDDGKKSFKDYFTLSNISLAIIALGAVFTIISAALGCINRDTWVDATSSFMKESGYMTEPTHIQNFKDVIQAQNAGDKNISTINIDFKDKQAVIIYVGTESPDKLGFVTYDYYIKYENQIVKTRTKDGVITLTETPAPKLDDTAIKKIFFFMFKDFDVEKQVLIYLPEDTREGAPNEIKIIGDNVIYAKQVDKTDKAE